MIVLGIDLDNTIIDYDAVFRAVALEAGLIEPTFSGGKRALRDALRTSGPDGEARWTWVQAQAYGPRLNQAQPFPGVERFTERCTALGIPMLVVSHKSTFAAADPSGVNLREAASAWLGRRFPVGTFANVVFENTRAEKLARIAALGFTHFIDDLLEVLVEPDFPREVARWQFDPADSAPAVEGIERFSSWAALTERIEREQRIWSLAERLVGPIEAVSAGGAGGNNPVWRVRAGGRRFAIKEYGVNDERRRLDREVAALRLFAANGVPGVARLAAADPTVGAAAFEWIEGEPAGPPRPGDVGRALEVIAACHRLRLDPAAAALLPAAEAGLSAGSVWEGIDARLARLRACAPDLTAFLGAFEQAFGECRGRFAAARDPRAELAVARQTLSPSDFGFHNALRRGGDLVFVDFEYFGWDDPVKLVADFLLHPGMTLETADKKRWLSGTRKLFANDPDFNDRLAAFFATYALKWCLILLNEFRPEVWQRRVAARPGRAWEAAKVQQLAKAYDRLERIDDDEAFLRAG